MHKPPMTYTEKLEDEGFKIDSVDWNVHPGKLEFFYHMPEIPEVLILTFHKTTFRPLKYDFHSRLNFNPSSWYEEEPAHAEEIGRLLKDWGFKRSYKKYK
jgi:hypothetical protein